MGAIDGCAELMYAHLDKYQDNTAICDRACRVLRHLARHRKSKSAIKKRLGEDEKLSPFKKQVFPSAFSGFRSGGK